MDPLLAGWDLVGVLVACVACGVAGGIAFDLTEPILRRRPRGRPADPSPPAGGEESFGDNRLATPRRIMVRGRRFWEAGFVGPMFIGAIAAVIAVLLLAVN